MVEFPPVFRSFGLEDSRSPINRDIDSKDLFSIFSG
jgi:hypothetical protein